MGYSLCCEWVRVIPLLLCVCVPVCVSLAEGRRMIRILKCLREDFSATMSLASQTLCMWCPMSHCLLSLCPHVQTATRDIQHSYILNQQSSFPANKVGTSPVFLKYSFTTYYSILSLKVTFYVGPFQAHFCLSLCFSVCL